MNNIWTPPPVAVYLPLVLILSFISVMIGIVTITMTVLYNKAETEDREDKISYISQIWVGSKSGFLHSLMLLWCPVLLVLALYGPIRMLLPWKDRIGKAVQQMNFSPLAAGIRRI